MIPRRFVDLSPEEEHAIHEWLESEAAGDESLIPEWERRVAALAGVKGAAAVSSGRRGMACIFEHLGLGEGGEVIVPAWTLGELIPLIEGFGAKLVPADIDPESFNMTSDTVKARITPATRAVLAVHLFGAPCDIPAIQEVAGEIPVIEDCAHSLGGSLNGVATGAMGRAGFYSFETTKPVNTFGGGMVVSNDEALITRIREINRDLPCLHEPFLKRIRDTRTEQKLFRTGLAYLPLYLLASPTWKNLMNRIYRQTQQAARSTGAYTPVQAKFGMQRFDALEERIAKRAALADQYRKLLKPSIRMQQLLPGAIPTWYFLVAVLPVDAAPVRLRLLIRGIDAGVDHEIMDDCAAMLGDQGCPNVADIFRRAIVLPMYEELRADEVSQVAEALNRLVP